MYPERQLTGRYTALMRHTAASSVVLVSLSAPVTTWACTVAGITSNVELMEQADSVIRAKALKYAKRPSDPNIWTTGVPDSEVRFEELEVIRGIDASGLVLPGYLV